MATEKNLIKLPDNTHITVQNNVLIEPTKDAKLFRVYENKHPIGSVRQEKDKWAIYGVFVESTYNTI